MYFCKRILIQNTLMKCNQCGTECPDNFNFCPNCGSPLFDNNVDKLHSSPSFEEDITAGKLQNCAVRPPFDISKIDRTQEHLDLSGYSTSHLTSTSNLFVNVKIQIINCSGWDVSNVTEVDGMFFKCHSLQSLNLNGWDVSNVEIMGWMFHGCSSIQCIDLKDGTCQMLQI